MKAIQEYLNEVKKRAGIDSDKELALKVGVHPTSIFYIRKGTNIPSDEVCKKLADIVGDPVEKVLLLAAESRAPESTKTAWHNITKKLAKAGVFTLSLAIAISILLASPGFFHSISADSVYYVKLLVLISGLSFSYISLYKNLRTPYNNCLISF